MVSPSCVDIVGELFIPGRFVIDDSVLEDIQLLTFSDIDFGVSVDLISEETGGVSLAAAGTLVQNVDRPRLRRHLKNFLTKKEMKKNRIKVENTRSFSHRVEELKEKVLSSTKEETEVPEEESKS